MQRMKNSSPTIVNQRGLALIIVMIFLSAITGITIWAVRQSLMGEGMARNQLDLEVARQAAEAALRDAERDIMNLTAGTLPNASCSRGLVTPPLGMQGFTENCDKGLCLISSDIYATANWTTGAAANAEPWWPQGKGGQWNNDFSPGVSASGKPSRQPVNTDNCSTFVGAVPLGTYTGAAPVTGVAVQPEYLIEYFNRASSITLKPAAHYRITARGFGYTQRTQVVLQTIYAPLQEP